MSQVLVPLSNAAILRAEAVDPNGRRCLIENVSGSGAIEVAHVFNRQPTMTAMERIEYNWTMRKNTLNLDSRQNIFFRASMHEMYKKFCWTLIPEERIVKHYFHDIIDMPRRRGEIIPIQGDVFNYKLVPLYNMEDVCIFRQESGEPQGKVTVYHYPFEDLPTITSHIHPKYVILHLGHILFTPASPARRELLRKYPWFDDVEDLASSWVGTIPFGAYKDRSYRPIDHSSNAALDDDGSQTPLRRIQGIDGDHTPSETYSDPGSAFSDSQSRGSSRHGTPPQTTARKRSADEIDGKSDRPNKKRLLTVLTLERQDARDDLASVSWTSQRMLSWVKDCMSFSIPTSEAVVKKAPVRRSARVRGILEGRR